MHIYPGGAAHRRECLLEKDFFNSKSWCGQLAISIPHDGLPVFSSKPCPDWQVSYQLSDIRQTMQSRMWKLNRVYSRPDPCHGQQGQENSRGCDESCGRRCGKVRHANASP